MSEHTHNPSVMLLGDGSVETRHAPIPEPGPAQARVRLLTGAVSTGTETTIIRRLRETPDPTREPLRLGYSAAGIVEEAGPDYSGPAPGTTVACYGAPYVGHSQFVIASGNLLAACAAPPDEAAFGGIGAIGMHALRLANVTLGERVGILGLGVLGQVTAQLARAAGAWVLASDPLPARAAMATELGADMVTEPAHFLEAARDFTSGEGLDAVLVVAGTPDSAAPARQALEALRFRGRLLIVGNVKTDWDREMLFQKEATVQVSRAAGPGRYDPAYEREGRDFPPGLVPWTEGRNLRCFVDLLTAARVQVAPLISEVLPVERAADAYRRLMERPQETMAVVLKFPPIETGGWTDTKSLRD